MTINGVIFIFEVKRVFFYGKKAYGKSPRVGRFAGTGATIVKGRAEGMVFGVQFLVVNHLISNGKSSRGFIESRCESWEFSSSKPILGKKFRLPNHSRTDWAGVPPT